MCWAHHCNTALRTCGFRPVFGWACLYIHVVDGLLFVPARVAIVRLVGRKGPVAATGVRPRRN